MPFFTLLKLDARGDIFQTVSRIGKQSILISEDGVTVAFGK